MLLFGCSTYTEVELAGCYTSKKTCEIIELNEDGTFLYITPNWPISYILNKSSKVNLSNKMICDSEKIIRDSIIGNYKILENGKYFIAKPSESFYKTEPCDTCQYTTIRIYDNKTKNPLEFATVELYDNSFVNDELYTDSAGCATIKTIRCDSVKIKYIEHNTITIHVPINTIIVDVYLTQKYDWWIDKWRIISKDKIKQEVEYGNTFRKRCIF